jgi:hypothetical protein
VQGAVLRGHRPVGLNARFGCHRTPGPVCGRPCARRQGPRTEGEHRSRRRPRPDCCLGRPGWGSPRLGGAPRAARWGGPPPPGEPGSECQPYYAPAPRVNNFVPEGFRGVTGPARGTRGSAGQAPPLRVGGGPGIVSQPAPGVKHFRKYPESHGKPPETILSTPRGPSRPGRGPSGPGPGLPRAPPEHPSPTPRPTTSSRGALRRPVDLLVAAHGGHRGSTGERAGLREGTSTGWRASTGLQSPLEAGSPRAPTPTRGASPVRAGGWGLTVRPSGSPECVLPGGNQR